MTPRVEALFEAYSTLRAVVDETLGDRVADRPMRTFATHWLDRDYLARVAARSLPEGIQVRAVDVDTARRFDSNLEPHALQVFPSPEALVAEGLGVVGGYSSRARRTSRMRWPSPLARHGIRLADCPRVSIVTWSQKIPER